MSTATLQRNTNLSDSAAQARINVMLGKSVSDMLGEDKAKISRTLSKSSGNRKD